MDRARRGDRRGGLGAGHARAALALPVRRAARGDRRRPDPPASAAESPTRSSPPPRRSPASCSAPTCSPRRSRRSAATWLPVRSSAPPRSRVSLAAGGVLARATEVDPPTAALGHGRRRRVGDRRHGARARRRRPARRVHAVPARARRRAADAAAGGRRVPGHGGGGGARPRPSRCSATAEGWLITLALAPLGALLARAPARARRRRCWAR